MHDILCRDQDGSYKVVLAVASEFAERYLRAGEDDRLAEALKHEGKGRGAVGHCVGTVQYDESVIIIIS